MSYPSMSRSWKAPQCTLLPLLSFAASLAAHTVRRMLLRGLRRALWGSMIDEHFQGVCPQRIAA